MQEPIIEPKIKITTLELVDVNDYKKAIKDWGEGEESVEEMNDWQESNTEQNF